MSAAQITKLRQTAPAAISVYLADQVGEPGLFPSKLHRESSMSTSETSDSQPERGCMTDLIRTSIYEQHSDSMKFTTHLDHISHCRTASGTNWSNRWTYPVLGIIINARRDLMPWSPLRSTWVFPECSNMTTHVQCKEPRETTFIQLMTSDRKLGRPERARNEGYMGPQ